MRSILLGIAIVAGLLLAGRGEARAALHVCNASPETAAVAIAVIKPNASGVEAQSEGWFQIDTGTCQLVIDTDLDPATLYYLYAKGTTITWSGNSGKTTNDASFCTNFAGGFNYVDRQSSLCTGAGEQMLRFINEPITGPDWTINLDVPD